MTVLEVDSCLICVHRNLPATKQSCGVGLSTWSLELAVSGLLGETVVESTKPSVSQP